MAQRIFRTRHALALLETCPDEHPRQTRIYQVRICNTDGDTTTLQVCFDCSTEALEREGAQPRSPVCK